MKKSLLSLALLMSVPALYGQNDLPTYGYSYQAIIRDKDGQPIANQPAELRFQILNSSGQKQYEETQSDTADQFGKVVCVVGSGTATHGLFDTLNWAARKHFLHVEAKIGGAADWADLGSEEIVQPSINRPPQRFTFKSKNNIIYYWEISGTNFYLYDPQLQKYRIFFDGDGRCGIGKIFPEFALDVNGDARVKTLTILGNDRTHLLNTTDGGQIPAFTVVVFDEMQPGKIRPCTTAYDRKVAGVVSNTDPEGKHRPGIIHAQENTAGGSPVAIDGTVEVLAVGPVAVGDLLTSSAVPGHAMAITDPLRGIGCTIGKAMTPLAKGEKGKVEMWVERH